MPQSAIGSRCFSQGIILLILIGNCFFATPPVIDAARVRENWFLAKFIMGGRCQSGTRPSSGKFCRFLGGFWRRRGRNRQPGEEPAQKWAWLPPGRAVEGLSPVKVLRSPGP